VVLALAVLGTGGGMLTYRSIAAERTAAERAAAQQSPAGGPGARTAPPREGGSKQEQRWKAELDSAQERIRELLEIVGIDKRQLAAKTAELEETRKLLAKKTAELEDARLRLAQKASDQAALGAVQPSPEQRALPALIEQARDEVELLEVQRAVKRAQYEAAKVGIESARMKSGQFERLHATGAVDQRTVMEARTALAELEAQVRVKEAELLEPEVRLKQARRRLAGLEKQAAPAPARTDPGQRLQALEKKLDALRQEVEALRRELRPQKPGERRPGEP
jgi:hypothetical protein